MPERADRRARQAWRERSIPPIPRVRCGAISPCRSGRGPAPRCRAQRGARRRAFDGEPAGAGPPRAGPGARSGQDPRCRSPAALARSWLARLPRARRGARRSLPRPAGEHAAEQRRHDPGGVEVASNQGPGVDLTGHHSNPLGPLGALLKGTADWRTELDRVGGGPRGGRLCAAGPSIGSKHRRHDWVQEVVVRVLEQSLGPMRAREMHAAAEALLGEPVRWGSVKACLAANVAGPVPRFVRVGPGRYEICVPRV